MYEMIRMMYVPVSFMIPFPPKAERSAIDTTVPGRMNGAMMDRSRRAAPFGFFLSVMYARTEPKMAHMRVAVMDRKNELNISCLEFFQIPP